jgi:hypothetical protein
MNIQRVYASDVAFTPSVKAVQARNGSRPAYQRMEEKGSWPTDASGEIVKLIHKLRWVGLEEKAEQLENQLEHQAATTDTVVSIQNETD